MSRKYVATTQRFVSRSDCEALTVLLKNFYGHDMDCFFIASQRAHQRMSGSIDVTIEEQRV